MTAAKNVGAVVQRVKTSITDAGSTASHKLTQAVQVVGREASALKRMAEQACQRNPLAVGASSFAAGAAIGMIFPSTTPEDSLLGSARDSAMHAAGDLAHGVLNRIENLAKHVADAPAAQSQG